MGGREKNCSNLSTVSCKIEETYSLGGGAAGGCCWKRVTCGSLQEEMSRTPWEPGQRIRGKRSFSFVIADNPGVTECFLYRPGFSFPFCFFCLSLSLFLSLSEISRLR